MTVLEAIQRSADFLQRKEVDSPRLQAELLLAHVLKLPRLKLYLQFERVLTLTEEQSMRELVQRRGKREPLQHLVGSVSFCGYELEVTPDVLIPRPETETLAELAWTFLNRLPEAQVQVLDLGAGSGCLPISIAAKCAKAVLTAVDVSPAALAVAMRNAERHQQAVRIQFMAGDLFQPLPVDSRYHLIVSNPPYIASGEIPTLQPEVRDHDPVLALDGGSDGLDFYRRLAAEGLERLHLHGCLMAEFGDEQGADILQIFAAAGWQDGVLEKDLSGRERFVIASRKRA